MLTVSPAAYAGCVPPNLLILQMRWREYVPVAWQVDPALALSLQDHFPANSDIKHALEALVVEHAHAAKVGSKGRAH